MFDEFSRELCLHDYEVIEKQVETYHENEVTSIGEIQYSTITGYIVVYCRKCLDVQVRELG